jgi:hypothetical protein
MKTRLSAHPQNSEGDFYVVDGECMGCGAPEQQAATMMSHDSTGHCFFIAQPESSDQLNAALRALWSSCCGAVRYGGVDPVVLTRLAQMGEASACDQPTNDSSTLIIRNHAKLTYVAESLRPVKEIVDFIAMSLPMGQNTFTRGFDYSKGSAAFVYEWGTRDFRCSAKFRVEQSSENAWIVSLTRDEGATLGLAMALDTSLRTNNRFGKIRWLTNEQLASGSEGTEHPY